MPEADTFGISRFSQVRFPAIPNPPMRRRVYDEVCEVRLGGIYALERIDKESPERAYHSTVMEVLTAYVRENPPWPPKSAKPPEENFMKPPGDSATVSASDETAEQCTA